MKVYRYMSNNEFALVTAGVEVVGRRYMTSRSVCFLPETVVINGGELVYTPEESFIFLRGIVSNDVLVEFETDADLENCCGDYCDPRADEWGEFICVNELSISAYSLDNFKPLRYCFPGEFTWYNC